MTDELFRCQRCGHCCQGQSTVSLSPWEQERIADFLGLEREVFLRDWCVRNGNRVEMKTLEGHCIHYGEDGLCKIHPVKPAHCKRWPLHPSILADRAAWKAIRADCPGFPDDMTYEKACELVRRAGGED